MNYRISNYTLCKIIWNSDSNQSSNKIDAIMDDIKSANEFSEEQLLQIKMKLRDTFYPQYCRQWRSVTRNKSQFISKYAMFLESDFTVDFSDNLEIDAQNNGVPQVRNLLDDKKMGRPRLSYEEGSEKTKKRRINELAVNHSKEELERALRMKDNLSKNATESEVTDSNEDTDVRNILAMYVDLDLTARKYHKLKMHAEMFGGQKSFPSYKRIVEAKNACYPESDHINVSESGAEIHFISLLGHTVNRILSKFNKDELEELSKKTIVLVGKWGMDGASGQQTTRQKWSCQMEIDAKFKDNENMSNDVESSDDDLPDSDADEEESNDDENDKFKCKTNNKNVDDSSIFLLSFVPLQLKADDNVIWSNETPNSVHFCRTMKFEFVKENSLLTLQEYNHFTNLLEKVELYEIQVNDVMFKLRFDLKCSMIDGKVCNVLCEQKASNCCNICRVGPKYINNLTHVKQLKCNENYYKFGLSTLHCWLRFMEFLLHIAYNLDFKKGAARTKEQKELKKLKKKHIQDVLKSKLSILVDVVKQGSGTTNTGNVARSFFAQAQGVAKHTGLDEKLIIRFYTILQVLTCGRMIDCDQFKTFCSKTAELCVTLYGWYPMPPSVHKVLIHGGEIIRFFDVPFGWLSEEPQEANNKIFRKVKKCRS